MTIKWDNLKGFLTIHVKTLLGRGRKKKKHKRKVPAFLPAVLIVERKIDVQGLGKETEEIQSKVPRRR